DNSGQSSKAPVTVLITPKAEPPVANAGNNQTVSAGDTVTLDGSASTDSDGTITSYQWTQTSGTPTVSLSAPNAASTTFVAPQDIAANTTLAFELTVTDNSGQSSKAPVTVLITPPPQPPVANAGNNQTVSAGDTVTVDGSASTDSDGTITSYQWTQSSGTPTVSLSAPNAASTTFVAPQDIAANTTLAFELTVTDNSGQSST